MKEEIKLIQEYDALLAKEGKVSKTNFAVKTGIAKSSLCTILNRKKRQSIETADFYEKAIEGRKGLNTTPFEELNSRLTVWYKQMMAKHIPIGVDNSFSIFDRKV